MIRWRRINLWFPFVDIDAKRLVQDPVLRLTCFVAIFHELTSGAVLEDTTVHATIRAHGSGRRFFGPHFDGR